MKNELKIISDNNNCFIAIFSGKTGSEEIVKEEEAHNICGTKEEVIEKALAVWGASKEETNIEFDA